MPSYDPRGVESPRAKRKKRPGGVRNSAGRQDELRQMGGSRANGNSRDYMQEQTGQRSGSRRGNGTQQQDITTSGPTATLDNVPMSTPRSALGQDYTGAYYPDLFSNPDLLAQKWGDMAGLTPQNGGGMQKVYQDLANVMPQLFFLTQGANGNQASDVEYARFLDFAESFLNGMSTPGGGNISSDVIGNIFSAGGDSPLSKFLNNPNLDTAQQMSNLLGLVGGGLSTSMPGAMASAYAGDAEQLAKQWYNQQASSAPGQSTSLVDYLRQQGFGDLF